MGAKVPKMPPPPAVDPEVATKEAESAAKLEAEKKKAISLRKKGMGGTILTGGQGVEEEAKTAATSLMQY
jgi:hypothetical protein|tara:strand:+ start:360 stop:569 length:210 start_codon:yes stop_codon:yes gene_type:complete